MFDQVGQNKRRTALLIFVFVVLTVAVFAVVFYEMKFGSAAIGLAVVAAGTLSFISYWTSDRIALAMSRARPAPPERYARLHNLVEGLCIAGGLPKPRIYVIDDDAPNAFATGRNPKNAAIAVTSGLLAKMNRAELEGVLAIVGFVLLLAAPLLAALMQYAVSRNRETLADVSGAELTRYPPGLISALEKLRDDQTVVHSHSRATAHMWIESPLPREKSEGRLSRLNKMFDTHPPLEERIAALRQL